MGTTTSKNGSSHSSSHGFRDESHRSKDNLSYHDSDEFSDPKHSSSSQSNSAKWWKLRYRHNHGHKSKSLPNPNDSLLLFKDYLNGLNNTNILKLLHIYNKCEHEYIEWRKCESSRFVGNTIEQDLENLLDYKYNCDINLNINSVASFPAHISILKQRSSYFKALLFNCEERYNQIRYGADHCYRKDPQRELRESSGCSSSGAQYGYGRKESCSSTSQISQEQQQQLQYNSYHRSSKELKQQQQQQQHPYERKLLSVDLNLGSTNIHNFSKLLRYLYTGIDEEQCRDVVAGTTGSGVHGDENRIIIGVNPGKNSLKMDLNEMLTSGNFTDLILIWRCNKLNSEYVFPCHKSILSARSPFFRNLLSRSMHQNELEIDENIIQKKYALLLLTCLYTDVLDLSLIGRYTTQQMVGEDRKDEMDLSDGNHKNYFEVITQIYQIGRFLEFDLLCNQCEDLIINNILNNSDPSNNVDGNTVLKVLKWSSEAFGSKYIQRQCIQYILFNYNEFVKSNNLLQALNEEIMEILVSSNYVQASECEILCSLLQWCNLQLTQTAVLTDLGLPVCQQRGLQRNEHNAKLSHLLRPFIKWIRFEQVLNRSVLNQCLMNNLFGSMSESDLILNFMTRPRYLQSFHNEIKATLYSKQNSFVPASSNSSAANCIPDTLYMLDGCSPATSNQSTGPTGSQSVDNNIVIEPELLAAMKQREKKLCSQNKQADLTPSLLQYIRLRIVREFGFPDSAVQTLNGVTRGEESWNDTSPSTSLSNRMPDVAIVDTSNCSTLLPNTNVASTSQLQRESLEQGLIDLDLGDGINIASHTMGTLSTSSNSSLGRVNHFRVDLYASASEGRRRGDRGEHDDRELSRKEKHRTPRYL